MRIHHTAPPPSLHKDNYNKIFDRISSGELELEDVTFYNKQMRDPFLDAAIDYFYKREDNRNLRKIYKIYYNEGNLKKLIPIVAADDEYQAIKLCDKIAEPYIESGDYERAIGVYLKYEDEFGFNNGKASELAEKMGNTPRALKIMSKQGEEYEYLYKVGERLEQFHKNYDWKIKLLLNEKLPDVDKLSDQIISRSKNLLKRLERLKSRLADGGV